MLLLLHAASTFFMVGLIWFVQIVHYPLFAYVGGSSSPAYAAQHQRRTGWVVGPPMLMELVTAVLLVVATPPGVAPLGPWIGAALLAVVWLSTAVLQIPAHRRLTSGWDAEAGARLVATNWVRTGAWTARGVLALGLLAPTA